MLRAAANVFNVIIVVVSSTASTNAQDQEIHIQPDEPQDGRPCPTFYIGHDVDGEHYVPLVQNSELHFAQLHSVLCR